MIHGASLARYQLPDLGLSEGDPLVSEPWSLNLITVMALKLWVLFSILRSAPPFQQRQPLRRTSSFTMDSNKVARTATALLTVLCFLNVTLERLLERFLRVTNTLAATMMVASNMSELIAAFDTLLQQCEDPSEPNGVD